ncbi:hypothetical protein GCM10010339_66120 [Streptomyces alanosinicus]|uniref:Uncharacterized protein n=1 Tax=Streptomyces alanosinicus TaxID=68171 RepID=A0A919D5Q5_9ACTN|nr:hypothetical protein GCM10010339_66120 [Streptomyces alanosinicus]
MPCCPFSIVLISVACPLCRRRLRRRRSGRRPTPAKEDTATRLPGSLTPAPCPTGRIYPSVRLTLDDGVGRTYLLDPRACAGTRCGTYEPRVHLAHVLARQGHRPDWLAEFTGLPPAAARRIADVAAPH